MKKLFHFSMMQTAILCLLAAAGVFLLLNARPYQAQLEEGTYPARIPFLEKGEYTLEVTYEHSPKDNRILIFSRDVTGEDNQPGAVYSELEIPEGSGVVLVPLALEQPTYGVTIGTALDTDDAGYVSKAFIQSNRLIHKDNYLLGAMLLLGAAVLALLFRKADLEPMPIVLVCMGLAASLPLFSDFLFWEDDVAFHLTRLEGIYRGLAAGEFPVRITSQQMAGYGGATGIMYPQLFLYPAALLRFLGASVMLCYKSLLVCINVATAFTAYLAARHMCGSKRIALWMSVFYTFSLYRLVNLYMRGALGESLAMVFLPLILWGGYEVLWGERRWQVLVIGMTGVLESHVLSVEMCVLFLTAELLFWLSRRNKDHFGKRLLDGLKAIGATLLLNAGFLVPFLYFSGEDLQCFHILFGLSDSAAYFSQIFSFFPTAGDGISLPLGSTQGEMPLTMGGTLLVGAVLFLLAGAFPGRDPEGKRREGIGAHCLVLGGLAVLLASWIFPWERVAKVEILRSIFGSLQFSWRFLGLATLFWSMTSAIGIAALTEKKEEGKGKDPGWLCGIMAALVLLSAGALFDSLAQDHQQRADKMAMDGSEYTDGLYAYRYREYFQPIELEYKRSEAYIRTARGSEVEYSGYRREGSGLWVDIVPQAGKEDELIFPIYWYPGYEVRVNGGKVPSYQKDGLLGCELPGEAAHIRVRYRGPWSFALADAVTFLTVGAFAGCGLYRYRRHRRRSAGAV